MGYWAQNQVILQQKTGRQYSQPLGDEILKRLKDHEIWTAFFKVLWALSPALIKLEKIPAWAKKHTNIQNRTKFIFFKWLKPTPVVKQSENNENMHGFYGLEWRSGLWLLPTACLWENSRLYEGPCMDKLDLETDHPNTRDSSLKIS